MKKWLEPVTTAFTGVVTHKLRSFLTIMGIVIGVAAVIALMSIGKGAQADILSRIQTLGSNLVTIRPGSATSFGGVRGAQGSVTSLTMEDAQAIQEQVSNITAVAPMYSSRMQIVAGGNNTNSSVYGVTAAYMRVNNLSVGTGSFFTDYDYARGARVAVIGSNVRDTLFPDADPIGQTARMGSIVVHVIGVLESKGEMFGSPDDSVLIPLTAMQQAVSQPRTPQGDQIISTITLTVTDEKKSTDTVQDITSLLRTRHHLAESADNDFNVTSMEEIAQTISAATGTMTLLLGAIAAISLLVGGIGVMNIMLVSVLERTREIGIRKALGAREQDIWMQFLIEAAMLTFSGGIIGVAIGWAVSYIVSQTGVMSTLVSLDIVILAVSVSVGIGLFFGFYPAWNASRLNPIEALRSE
ncbi:MAG: ABC transporter permease [Chloroflexota bacterium]